MLIFTDNNLLPFVLFIFQSYVNSELSISHEHQLALFQNYISSFETSCRKFSVGVKLCKRHFSTSHVLSAALKILYIGGGNFRPCRSPSTVRIFSPRDAKIRRRRLSPLQSISFLSFKRAVLVPPSSIRSNFRENHFSWWCALPVIKLSAIISQLHRALYRSPYLRHDPHRRSPIHF